MRILVVEDEKKVASFIKKGLQEEGYAVDMVHDGQEALVNAAAFDYDLLILDLMLPKLAGLEVLREIRSKKRNLPVLVLTAKGAVDDKVAGLDAGADDYLIKPFAFAELPPGSALCSGGAARKLRGSGSPIWNWIRHRVRYGVRGRSLTSR